MADVPQLPGIGQMLPAVYIIGLEQLFANQARIEKKLDELRDITVFASTIIYRKEGEMADQLADVAQAAADLGIDVQAIATATDQLQDQVAALDQQLADAGVDPAARQGIIDSLTQYQTSIRSALDPNVPVPPPEPTPEPPPEPPVEEGV